MVLAARRRSSAVPYLIVAALFLVLAASFFGARVSPVAAAFCEAAPSGGPGATPGPGETPASCETAGPSGAAGSDQPPQPSGPQPSGSGVMPDPSGGGVMPEPSGGVLAELPLDPDGSDHAVGTVTSGGSVTTDGASDYATPGDPVETRVVAPNGGPVSIDEIAPSTALAAGFPVIGQQVNIATPNATAPSPYPVQLEFFLDPVIWSGVDPSAIRVVYNGALVAECDNRSFIASPDPCELFFNTRLIDGDRWINIWTTSGTTSWLFVVLPAADSAGGSVPAGGTVTTDPEADGASVGDQVETTIQTPFAGTISIAEGPPSTPAPAGFTFAGQEIVIEAPAATAASPLRLTFTIDPSALNGEDIGALQVFRNGALLGDCTILDGSATPDPCIASRGYSSNDAQLVVLTSHASRWNLATRPAYPFAGFYQPVDNPSSSRVVLNAMQAGAAVPIKFALGANQGLSVLAPGSPSSRQIACANGATLDPIETTTNATASGLRFDAATGQYIYTWKTEKVWAATCRRLTLKLIDGSSHVADFSFKK